MPSNRKVSLIGSLDWITIAIYFVLVILGWISIYAAAYNDDHQSIFDLSQRYGKQMLWIGMALGVIVLVLIIDSNFYSFFAYGIYGATILLLIAVLVFGKEVNGARSWFEIGSFRLQPAELAKFATCLAVSRYLSSENIKLNNINIVWILFSIILLPVGLIFLVLRKGVMQLVPLILILLLPSTLILLQNDTGSALIYVAFLIVLYREGLSWLFLLICLIMAALFIAALIVNVSIIVYVIIALGLVVFLVLRSKIKEFLFALSILIVVSAFFLGIDQLINTNISLHFILLAGFIVSSVFYIFWAYRYKIFSVYFIVSIVIASVGFTYSVDYVYNNVLEKHQQNRIGILLGLKEDPQGVGYNVNQSKIAIGSGGFYGKGFLKGTQTKFDFVPEQTTDFIFCTVGEEWGFIGTSVVILLFTFLLLRLLFLAERQRSKFSRIYGYGVISILFFHLLINIGMTIGLAPVIGIPLPFFSYGGSSLWSFTILLFIFLRLDASRLELLK